MDAVAPPRKPVAPVIKIFKNLTPTGQAVPCRINFIKQLITFIKNGLLLDF